MIFEGETELAGKIIHVLQSAIRLYQMDPEFLRTCLSNNEEAIKKWMDERDSDFFKQEFGELFDLFERQLEMFNEIFNHRNFSSLTVFSNQTKEILKKNEKRILTVFFSYSLPGVKLGSASFGSAKEYKTRHSAKLGQEIQGILTNEKDAVKTLLEKSGFTSPKIQIYQCSFESSSLNYDDIVIREIQTMRRENEANMAKFNMALKNMMKIIERSMK
jgi:hypothetical protein